MPALRIAAALALFVGGCPTPPVEAGAGEGDGAGGDEGAGAGAPARALPASALDPLASPLIVRARERVPGGEVKAIVVRGDVAIATEASSSWIRVGLVLGPFGLRWFERAPRGIEDASYGVEPRADAQAGAIARAVASEAAWLDAEECEALPDSVCAALLSEELARADEAIAGEVRRVAVRSVGAVVTTGDGEVRLVEGEDGEPVAIE